jgi:hypothetical protein
LPGGNPKAIELYVRADISDLSDYGLGSANNGGGSDGNEFTLTGSASAGEFLYIASESDEFANFFGFAPTYTSGAAAINGDDAIELFRNDVVVDTFGDINMDGSGQGWDHLDGWAYRVSGSEPSGATFKISEWTFSGIDALDGALTNAAADPAFPVGDFASACGGVSYHRGLCEDCFLIT